MITVKEEKVTRYNPINKQFNQTVHKAVIDIQKDKAVVLIKIPKPNKLQNFLKKWKLLLVKKLVAIILTITFHSHNVRGNGYSLSALSENKRTVLWLTQ